jgi:hypothetical protein
MADDVKVTKCLYFKANEATFIKRCMKRAETSGRVDDNMESLIKRLKTFNE